MSKKSASSSRHASWYQPFSERASHPTTPPLAAYLYRLMVAKRTNLCLSADVQSSAELLDVAEDCGNSICVLKTHADMISDFGERTIRGLAEIAARKKFLIFEDRKFGDIGNTVQAQYAAGPYRIASWANIVNAHIFPGPAVVTALKSAASSAVAAYNTSSSTEISGGTGVPGKPKQYTNTPPREEEDNDDDDDEEEESEESDDYESDDEEQEQDAARKRQAEIAAATAPVDIPTRPSDSYQRKPSVISISTTISSSTEVFTSPWDPDAPPSSLKDRPPLARGLLLLAQMSSEDNLFTAPYTAKCIELARQHRDFVIGFIGQESCNREPDDNFLVMTPGISMPPLSSTEEPSTTPPAKLGAKQQQQQRTTSKSSKPRIAKSPKPTTSAAAPAASQNSAAQKGDGLGQQYNSPRHVILERGVDVIIVGRGILNAEDREAEAERYRREGWDAILERTS